MQMNGEILSDKLSGNREIKHELEKYRIIVENIHDTVLMYNSDLIITYVSGNLKHSRYTAEEIFGKSIYDFIPFEKLNEFKDKFDAILKLEGNINHFEIETITKENKIY